MSAGQRERQVAIVTGAGSGIGRAIALDLAKEGFSLCLVGRTVAKLEATDVGCGGGHLILAGDLAVDTFAASVVDRCVERFGRLDVLVNAAGVAPLAPIGRTDRAMLDICFATNTYGPAQLIIRAWPVFQRQRSGRVVNVSTIGTLDPFPGFLAYAASKSALDSFTRSVAREGASIGVQAWSVNPGAVETPLLRQNFRPAILPPERTLSPEAVAAVAVACAMGRRGEPSGSIIALPSP